LLLAPSEPTTTTPFLAAPSQRIVYVPLGRRECAARLREFSLNYLDSIGLSKHWHLADNGTGSVYVRSRIAGTKTPVSVARLILGEDRKGTLVRYHDGDPLNLCHENLYVLDNPYSDPTVSREEAQRILREGL
jgi:hypothetical protein